MTIPHTIELESGSAICASVVNGKVLLVVSPNALLTRAECDHVGDLLWACGVQAEPPKKPRYIVGSGLPERIVPRGPKPIGPPNELVHSSGETRAKPITSVEDPRVKG